MPPETVAVVVEEIAHFAPAPVIVKPVIAPEVTVAVALGWVVHGRFAKATAAPLV